MNKSDTIIKLTDVTYKYDNLDELALDNISFNIKRGEMLAVIGHNGSGKSTLAKHFNALLLPSSGTVEVEGMDTRDENLTLSIRKRVGMVFQNPDNQIVTTVVEEDVGFGPENLGIPTEQIIKRVEKALLEVNMSEYAKGTPHMLSGGQKQRIAIAGMLAMHPDILVLDEATAMLDPQGRNDILNVVKKLNQEQNITVIMITQFMEEAAMANRVALMSKGKLIAIDTPRSLFKNAALLRSHNLDVPAMANLRDSLRADGLNLQDDILTVKEMADALCPLLLKT